MRQSKSILAQNCHAILKKPFAKLFIWCTEKSQLELFSTNLRAVLSSPVIFYAGLNEVEHGKLKAVLLGMGMNFKGWNDPVHHVSFVFNWKLYYIFSVHSIRPKVARILKVYVKRFTFSSCFLLLSTPFYNWPLHSRRRGLLYHASYLSFSSRVNIFNLNFDRSFLQISIWCI